MRPERRAEPRWIVDPGRFEPLWLVARRGTVGGQATLRDVSTRGLCVIVDRRQARRLVSALAEAQSTQELVEVARIPRDGYRRARVAWSRVAESQEAHFGLSLTEPLQFCVAELGAQ